MKHSDKLWFKFCWVFLEVVNTFSYDIENWCNKWFKKLELLDSQEKLKGEGR